MERDPLQPNPGELTGQGGSVYPNNMPDGGSGSGPETYSSQQQDSPEAVAQRERVAESPDAPESTREVAEELIARDREAAIQARMNQIINDLRREGEKIDADTMHAARVVAENAVNNASARAANRNAPGGRTRADGPRSQGGRRGQEPESAITQIDPGEFTDPQLKNIAEQIRTAQDNNLLIHDKKLLEDLRGQVHRIAGSAQGDLKTEADELGRVVDDISDEVSEQIRNADFETRGTFNLYLTKKDFEELEEDPMMWLRNQINKIYNFSAEGQEQSSPLVQGAQQLHERALSWLTQTEQARRNPKLLREFSEQFTNRLYTMFARSAVQQKNMEGIGGIAGQLGTHGVLNTLSFEGGLVNRMHNRINEVYDDKRITLPQNHITPVVHNQIQTDVIEEYTDLILRSQDPELYREIGLNLEDVISKGGMSDQRKEDVARENIRRAVRTAYDHFVASQREAVIVARGNALPTSENLQGILADPSALFQMFNIEQLLVAKFGTLNEEQSHFFQAIKRRYAESELSKKKNFNLDKWVQERVKINPDIKHDAEHHKISVEQAALEDYGAELMRDIMQVNDWYSSGWKLDEFMRQLDQNMQYRIAKQKNLTHIGQLSEADRIEAKRRSEEFGLFMRLRNIQNGSFYNLEKEKWGKMSTEAKNEYKDKERVKVWKKIATYKPEDIVRMFREHGAADGSELAEVNQAFREAGITLTDVDIAEGRTTLYDKFKYQYGSSLRLIREMGYDTKVFRDGKWEDDLSKLPEQIDFSKIMSNERYVKILENTLGAGEAQKIATLFGKLQTFAGKDSTIEKLMKESRFNFVNLRTFTVDDGLLDRMEQEDLKFGLTALSKKLSPEAGGDAYKRTFNDATAAAEAYKQLLTFITAESSEEKLKAAQAAAGAVKAYRDPGIAALTFRYTYGSYMLMGAITEFGALKGRGRSPVNALWETLDWKKLPMNRPVNELQRIFGPEAPAFNNDDLWLFLQHHKNDLVGGHGQEHWDEMLKLSRNRARDRNTLKAYRGVIFGMLWVIFETFFDVQKTIQEGLKSEDLN